MDLAESHTKILDYLIPNKSTFFTLNIGTGLGTSVLKLIRTFEQINNVKVRYKFAKRREGDVPFLVADNSLLLSKFNLKKKNKNTFAVKEAVFPFNKFPEVDVLLGPEMKSTGEAMGFDNNFGLSFARSQIASNNSIPLKGNAFISVKDKDKDKEE